MFKKAAAVFVLCAGIASWVGCESTVSRYVYAAVPNSNQIAVYREDPNSGVLTVLAGSPFEGGSGVQAVLLHPSQKYLYAANSGEGDISLYTITNGVPTESSSRTAAGTTPQLLTMDSAGSFLYVGNVGSSNVSIFSIGTTGTLTQVSGSPFSTGLPPLNLALAPSGNALYVTIAGSPGTLEVIGLQSGVPISPNPILQVTPTGTNPNGLAVVSNSSGTFLYTANTTDNSISEFAIQSDGTVQGISGSPIFQSYLSPLAILVDPSGQFLYAANKLSNNVTGYSIGSNGGLTVLSDSPYTTNSQPAVIGSDPSGRYVFVGNQASTSTIQSYSLNTSSGTLTIVNSYPVVSAATSIVVSK
jgi:6-phosphogluconolactonase